jgi:hypothetical protein
MDSPVICPNCGHNFTPLPKLSPELRSKMRMLLEILDERHGTLERGQLWPIFKKACPTHPWSMQSAMIHLKARGIIAHPPDEGGANPKYRWVIDHAKLKAFAHELWEKRL